LSGAETGLGVAVFGSVAVLEPTPNRLVEEDVPEEAAAGDEVVVALEDAEPKRDSLLEEEVVVAADEPRLKIGPLGRGE